MKLERQRWLRRLGLLFAVITPGLPQVLSKKYVLVGSVLFVFGTGSIVNLVMGPLSLSTDEIQTFDILHAIAIPNLSEAYPMEIDPAVASANNFRPIHPAGEPWFVQRGYRELLIMHILLYVVCALVSFRQQWKT